MSGLMLACSRRVACRRRVIPSAVGVYIDNNRWYSSTRPALDEETATKESATEDKKALRQIALEYGRRKAAYKRQVSKLRKDYMEEYQRHKAEDEAARETEQAEITRRRLERQRAKNERSVQNAIRQKELQRQAHLAFQDHLRVQQEKRDAKKILYKKARQLCIDDLEKEAPMWLTTPEEVDAAFSHEAEQLLWGRPHGVIGSPHPSLDSHFWQYETHTWDMSKTYKTQKQLLLEELEEEAFMRTNIDPKVWTPERVAEHEALERKARLRANVRSAGKRQLLKRQKEYLDEDSETQPGEPPKAAPIPSLRVLADIRAQEKEGSELLFKDPTQFFIFDGDQKDAYEEDGDADVESYSGPSLGAPVEVKDPLRGGDPNGDVFPVAVGKLPKPDTRSAKEKKREEREQRLWAAAQAQAKGADEIDMAADEDEILGEPIDYDNNDDWDSDDEEWEKGLDPETDAELLATPRRYRYTEADIEWVVESLKTRAAQLETHLKSVEVSLEQELRAKAQQGEESTTTGKFFDEATTAQLESFGADVDKFEALMSSFTDDQLLSIYTYAQEITEQEDVDAKELESVFEKVPGLTSEQVAGLIELHLLLKEAEKDGDES